MAFEAILFLAALILAAKLFGELLHRIGQPTILGNVLGGIIIGPTVFHLVSPIDEIELFISIGVFFLFFLIGLEEIDIPGLAKVLRKRIFIGSAIAFLIPFSVASVFGISIDIGFVKSLAIASVIGASSLGVTAKILSDLGKLRSTIGLEIFTMTAIVEFIAIIIVSVLIQINSVNDTVNIADLVWLFAKMILFFGIAGAFSIFALPRLLRMVKTHLKVKEVYFGTVIGIILLVAYFAEQSGIHGSIGALLLGIAVSRMPKDDYVEVSKSLHAIGYGIFIPIFFAGIGIHFLPNFISLHWWIIVGFLSIIVGVKFLGSNIAVRFAHMRPTRAVTFGVMSKGAVDLALLLSLLGSEIISDAMFSLLVFGTLITMIIAGSNLPRELKKHDKFKLQISDIGLMPIYFRNLANYSASDIMSTSFEKVNYNTTISEFTKKYPYKKSPQLIFDDDSKFLGVVSDDEISKIPKNLWDDTPVAKIVSNKFHSVSADDSLFFICQKINSDPHHIVIVISREPYPSILGVISADMLLEFLSQQEV